LNPIQLLKKLDSKVSTNGFQARSRFVGTKIDSATPKRRISSLKGETEDGESLSTHHVRKASKQRERFSRYVRMCIFSLSLSIYGRVVRAWLIARRESRGSRADQPSLITGVVLPGRSR
jgi:hypothetical protein